MRTITTAQQWAYDSGGSVHLRVDVEDGDGTLQSLRSFIGYNWILGADWGEDIDADCADATVTLRRDQDNVSLARAMQSSRANLNAGGTYDPLLALSREIRIYLAIVPEETTPAGGDWVLLFQGYIDAIDDSKPEITLTCRSRIARLIDAWVETPDTYSDAIGTAVETVMQSIVDDALGGGVITLYTPTSPGWNVTTFQTTSQPILSQLRLLSDQIGWVIRQKWDSGTSAFRPTFYTPDRAKATVDYTFDADTYLDVMTSEIALTDVRNAIQVEYGDASDLDADGAATRKTVTRTDATSIAAYGRRFMAVCEASTSNIDSGTEATAMADAILADLKDPRARLTIQTRPVHFVEIDDRYTFAADNVRFSAAYTGSVIGYRHRFTATSATTEIQIGGDVPRGSVGRWYDLAGAPGIAESLDMLGPIEGGISVVEAYGSIGVRAALSRGRDATYECHVGPAGFTPDITSGSTTLIGRTAGAHRIGICDDHAPVGELLDVVVYPLDQAGNRGTLTRSSNHRARRGGPQMLAPEARVSAGFPGAVFSLQTRGTTYPPDGWAMSVGTWSTDATLDTGATYAAPKTGNKALLLKNTATATAVVSDAFPVTVGRSYRLQLEFKASNATNTITISVEWLDEDQASLSTFAVYAAAAVASGTWQTVGTLVSPPTGARYARVTIAKAAAAFYVAFDRVIFEEAPAVDDEIHGVDFFDDYTDADPTATWSLTLLGADTASNPSTPSKVASATGTYRWGERGIVRLSTPAATSYGGVITLSDTPFYGLPPVGTAYKVKLRLPGTTSNATCWAGLFDSTTVPDSSLANSVHGIGVRSASAGSTATWKTIARDGTSETSVNLGVDADGSWVTIGFRRTLNGIQPILGDHDFGSEITTNIPADTTFTLLWGVFTTNAAAKDLDCDFHQLTAQFARYTA